MIILTSELTILGRELAGLYSVLGLAVWHFAILGLQDKTLDSDVSVLLVQRVVEASELA